MIRSIDSTQKHIFLLKLFDAYKNIPDFDTDPVYNLTAEKEWLSKLHAIFNSLHPIHYGAAHKTNIGMLGLYKDFALSSIISQIGYAIEDIQNDLEITGESDIGTIYEPENVDSFHERLKSIIKNAQSKITIVDPSFVSEAFSSYLSTIQDSVKIDVLSKKYVDKVQDHAERSKQPFRPAISFYKTHEIYDRLLIIDDLDCWLISNPIKDALKTQTYLIPLSPHAASLKIEIYNQIISNTNVYKKYKAV